MNKLTKGSLATGAGLVLLLGGTGTFMSWQDQGAVTGDDIVAGHLILNEASPGAWTSSAGVIQDITTYQVVPGETLTYTSTLGIDALGDHLVANLSLDGGSIAAANADANADGDLLDAGEQAQHDANAALAGYLTQTAVAKVASSTDITLTSDGAGGYNIGEGKGTVTVTATIKFPSTSLDDSQDGRVDLSNMGVKLTQTV